MLLLSLIGEQPIPNLLPLWQFKEYSATQLVATRTTLSVANTLHGAIQADPQLKHLEVLDTLIVEAYDIGQARGVLATALNTHLNQGREVRLNLTGGTKVMSLAALQAAYGTGIRLVYVATEINQVIFLGSDGAEISRQPIEVKVSTEQYLTAHGLQVSDYPNFGPSCKSRSIQQSKKGDKLEAEVYRLAMLAQQSGQFDDVRRNVYIRKQTEAGCVDNELDVVVTRNGRLAVCSCKDIQASTRNGRVAMREAIYELSSISRREAAGIYCGKVLVNGQPDMPEVLCERARANGVRLVYGPGLDTLVDNLIAATR
jgi:hypothetical protein